MRKNDETKEPKRDWSWFERTVAELKAELEKLPADRRKNSCGNSGNRIDRLPAEKKVLSLPAPYHHGADPEDRISQDRAESAA
jgi:hypothetical protein